MSAARLAAETAFATPRQTAPEPQPVITVRRSRGAGVAPPQAAAASGDPTLAAGAAKGPRIFRLGATGAPAVRPAAVESPPAPGPSVEAHAEAGAADRPHAAPAARRKRRIAAEQRPGPVVQVFRAPGDKPFVVSPANPFEPQPMGVTRAQAAVLAEMLARVQPLLDDIQRARAFRLADNGFAGQWQSLAAAVEELRRQIHSRSRSFSAAPI